MVFISEKEKLMLTAEEFKEELNKILELREDPGKVSELLTGLHSNYNEVMETQTELSTLNEKLKETNDSLVKSNGELFRQVGVYKEPETPIEEEEPIEPNKEELKQKAEETLESVINQWGEK